MANDNLKDFSIQWAMMALLFFSLMSFAGLFVLSNNPGALGEAGEKLSGFQSDIEGNLVVLENDSNELLNISAKSNPEESYLGSRDSVATSFGLMGGAKRFVSSIKLFMAWILPGESGLFIISVLVSIFGILSIYFITKWIRIGA